MSYGQATTGMRLWPWTLSEQDGRTFVKRALDLGINFFDTANNYSDGESEAVLGRAIRDFALRDEVVLATKVCAPVRPGPNGRGLSRKAVLSEVDKSLQRLCTDYIDLYQIHLFDKETPLEETLSALNDVVRAGKVRYLGAANLHAWQLMKAIGVQRAMDGRPSYRSRTCTTFSTARKSARCCRSACRKGWEPIPGRRSRVGA
jgi:aryl-alcohol dehydrogenase-like predicted oxidoreductase